MVEIKNVEFGPYGQILLFGDSLTEFSCTQERGFNFMPALQHAYLRRLDVLNRGYSGYNTANALDVLPEFMPTLEQAKVRIMVIFFGANDSILPATTGQDIPLSVYIKNLKALLAHPLIKVHEPSIMLITPPPVDEYGAEAADLRRGITMARRTAGYTKQYADACRMVGIEAGVTVVDIWTAIMTMAGWKPGEFLPGSKSIPQNSVLKDLFVDGVHFTPDGYKVLFGEFMKMIHTVTPNLSAQMLPSRFPNWRDMNQFSPRIAN